MFISPINLLFFIIIAGFGIGRIRICKISLGIAGILLVAILVGSLMNLLIPETHTEIIANVQSTMTMFSKLGSSLFVSVIGMQTGSSLKNKSKGSFIAFAIGFLMSISGVVIMLLISSLDKSTSYSTLLGVLCGALTSTPGLSSVSELIDIGSKNAIWGYSCSYLLGVSLVVLFVQFFNPKQPNNNATHHHKDSGISKIYPELITIGIVALSGNVFGNIYINLLNASLGSTVCTLIIGLIIGYIVHKKLFVLQMSPLVLNSFRNLGLCLFFVGTGYCTGLQSVHFDIKIFIYGALITLAATLCGWLLCRIAELRYSINTGFIVAGGMTSSPAYGLISSCSDEVYVNQFSFAYFGALMSLLISIQMIAR